MLAPNLPTVDEVARRLAEQAGVRWAMLSNHPGYEKYIYREKARELLAAVASGVSAEDPRAAPRRF